MKLLLVLALSVAVVAFSISLVYSQCQVDQVNTSSSISSYPMGGWTYIAVDDNVRAMALNCSVQWNQNQTNLNSFYKVVCVRNAQSQVVSGALYKINATISQTVCDKSTLLGTSNSAVVTQTAVDACALASNGKSLNCVFQYWVQPWLNNYALTNAQCV